MSKERARARAEREGEAARRSAANQERRAKELAAKRRRDRRNRWWRTNRLWSHGAAYERNKEKWAAIVTLVLMALLLAYLFTGSWRVVLGAGLVTVIAAPALHAIVFDRRN